MKHVLKFAVATAVLVLVAWGAISCIEANKEIRALCGTFRTGSDFAAIVNTLETGAYLRYKTHGVEGAERIEIESSVALGSASCTLQFRGPRLEKSLTTEHFRPETIAAVLNAILFAALAFFHLAVAAGMPLGRFAWGGTYHQLPYLLRAVSGLIAPPIWFAGISALVKSGTVPEIIPMGLADDLTWAFVLLMALSYFGNVASKGRPERLVMTPLSLFLFASTLVVALGAGSALSA